MTLAVVDLRDAALEQLEAEFPRVASRVRVAVLHAFLRRGLPAVDAYQATRRRITDACAQ